MLNLISCLKHRLLSLIRDDGGGREAWEDDPLSHPVLQGMSLEQLADLPFDRGPDRARSAIPCEAGHGACNRAA